MEARKTIDSTRIRAQLISIRDAKDGSGGIAGVSRNTGINRGQLSRYANGYETLSTAQEILLEEYISSLEPQEADAGASEKPAAQEEVSRPKAAVGTAAQRRFGNGGTIYYTKDYARAFALLDNIRAYRAMGVMIGHPGTGKTTAIREYVRTHAENSYYINCWPVMGMRDLLEAIADAIGITLKNGSRMRLIQQIMDALSQRPGAMLIYDEAENLRGDNVKKLEVLRKICDDTDSAAVLAGTFALEEALTHGGNGRMNLAQIYRRNHYIPMGGVSTEEARDMLNGYELSAAAREELIRIATDVRHGGLGNFVELLNICLNISEGGEVTREILKSAMKYKLLPR